MDAFTSPPCMHDIRNSPYALLMRYHATKIYHGQLSLHIDLHPLHATALIDCIILVCNDKSITA